MITLVIIRSPHWYPLLFPIGLSRDGKEKGLESIWLVTVLEWNNRLWIYFKAVEHAKLLYGTHSQFVSA
jgi:hypothetical protein